MNLKLIVRNEYVGSITVSIGVASVASGDMLYSLIKRADAALYRAKHAGRNQVSVSDTEERCRRPCSMAAIEKIPTRIADTLRYRDFLSKGLLRPLTTEAHLPRRSHLKKPA